MYMYVLYLLGHYRNAISIMKLQWYANIAIRRRLREQLLRSGARSYILEAPTLSNFLGSCKQHR